MDAFQVKDLLEQALRDPRNTPWLVYAALFVVALFASLLGSYMTSKGANLATKEDVTELTHLVERVRNQYAEQLAKLEHENRKAIELGSREHQLRLAALDRRLEAHQQGFTLWRKLLSNVHSPQCGADVMECQDWWNNNCLYLDSDASAAFVTAYKAAHLHKDLLQGKSSQEEIKSNWNDIVSAGDAIMRAVALPPIVGLGESILAPQL